MSNFKWTRAEAVAFLRSEAERQGKTPTGSSIDMKNAQRLIRMFGSMTKAQAAAGLVPNRPGMPRKLR